MSIWVEYWKIPEDTSTNSHAQLKEHLKWKEPENKLCRYFSDRESAIFFQKNMTEDGNHSYLKVDGGD
jgi:hypothetical protein